MDTSAATCSCGRLAQRCGMCWSCYQRGRRARTHARRSPLSRFIDSALEAVDVDSGDDAAYARWVDRHRKEALVYARALGYQAPEREVTVPEGVPLDGAETVQRSI